MRIVSANPRDTQRTSSKGSETMTQRSNAGGATRRRVLGTALALPAVMLGRTAQGQAGGGLGTAESPITIRLLATSSYSDQWTTALLPEFNKRFPHIKVQIDGVPYNEHLAKIMLDVTGAKPTYDAYAIDDPWVPGRNKGPSTTALHITAGAETRTETLGDARMLFAFEAEAISAAIAGGLTQAPHPAMSHADSIGNNATLDRWRAEVGYVTQNERAVPGVLRHVLPKGLPKMPMARIPGLDREISQLVMGCDNRNTVAEGAIIWDAWAEAGGNAFDTAHIYGGGQHEKVLGQWMAARGVARDMVVIAKGAHSPYCLPDAIGMQLAVSLDRLGISHAPVYIMHRDNPAVPVGEFVDVLNAQVRAGRIGVFGGSNWTPARIAQANSYAAANGLQGFSILNNNLSLAVMEKPVWGGCVTSNTPEMLAFLRAGGVTHVSWSSQARGYFLPEALRGRLPADTAPETCFGSPANAERRKRAETLAGKYGVSAHNIATAWVLSQPFPSFALIGPRSVGEIATTMPGALRLAADEVHWLNLERDAL